MLTPYDKILNKKNNIVQICITRMCSLFNCSNCTQLLPFRKDSMHMSLECCEKALQSMEDWPGVVACFGGNPLNHPKFPEIALLFEKYVPEKRRGLWTNDLLQHGEIAAKVFSRGVQNFNCHGDSEAAAKIRKFFPNGIVHGESGRDHHGAILQDYRDYGISEEEWIQKRESCDINQNWSGLIREHEGEPYVYFCEVAASIDGVLGQNNGLLAEKGWWKEPISKFQGQIDNCCNAGCGVPLRLSGHGDREFTYDMSQSWVDRVAAQKKGPSRIQVRESLQPQVHEITDYIGLRLEKGKK